MSGDLERFGAKLLARNMALRSAVESHPDAVTRHRCGLMLYSWGHISDHTIMQPTFSWEAIYGKDASVLLDVANSYDYDLDHAFMNAKTNGEFFHACGEPVVTLAVHFGKIEAALTQFDRALDVLRRCMEEPEQTPELPAIFPGMFILSHLAVANEFPMDRREAVAAMMVDWGLDWESADEKADELGAVWPWFRKRGDRTRNTGAIHFR